MDAVLSHVAALAPGLLMALGGLAFARPFSSERTTAMARPRSTDDDVRLGARILELRLAAGLRLQEVATVLGVSYQQLQKYERGLNRISAVKLRILADRLGISLDDFFASDASAREAA